MIIELARAHEPLIFRQRALAVDVRFAFVDVVPEIHEIRPVLVPAEGESGTGVGVLRMNGLTVQELGDVVDCKVVEERREVDFAGPALVIMIRELP